MKANIVERGGVVGADEDESSGDRRDGSSGSAEADRTADGAIHPPSLNGSSRS